MSGGVSVAAPFGEKTSQYYTSSAPNERRRYILSGLAAPPGLLTHGLRAFIVEQMRGRRVEGSVKRANLDEYGQCLIVVAIASPHDLNVMEEQVFPSEYWADWCRKDQVPRQTLSNHQFSIVQSLFGSVCGTVDVIELGELFR